MNGAVRIWEKTPRRLVLRAECESPHTRDVRHVWFPSTPRDGDGPDTFWTASNDGTICQWTLPEGERVGEVCRAPGEGSLEYQAISPSGKYALALRSDGSSLLWEIGSGAEARRFSSPTTDPYSGQIRTACVFTPDESCVAVMTGRTNVTLFQTTTGEPIVAIPGNGVALEDMSFSHDGRFLLTVSGGRAGEGSGRPRSSHIPATPKRIGT